MELDLGLEFHTDVTEGLCPIQFQWISMVEHCRNWLGKRLDEVSRTFRFIGGDVHEPGRQVSNSGSNFSVLVSFLKFSLSLFYSFFNFGVFH